MKDVTFPQIASPHSAGAPLRLEGLARASYSAAVGTTEPRNPSDTDEPARHSVFVTTHWSVVLSAGRQDTPGARAALENLCQTYWHPLYAFVRRRGYSPEDAQDLTQEFFSQLLRHNRFARASQERGRFRSFLLASMNHFLADAWDKSRAQKRGGGQVLPLDLQAAEARLGELTTDQLSPEKLFERRWAITLLEQVYQRLGSEYEQEGKGELFAALRSTLTGAGPADPYAELGRRLGMTEGAVKVAVHRLRHRYRELLRATIADTVAAPEEVEDELRYLLRTLSES
jgi:RNA polymerase sigma-70 factor (ECF subfamily)